MLELRILSGLHRGATLPLEDDTVVIGSDESADVVLLDPGIEITHASLRKTSEGWALLSLDGGVFSSETNEPLKSLDFQQGEFSRIGRVWISVVDSEAPWGEPPPDPVDIEPDDLQGGDGGSEELQPNDDAKRKHAAADNALSEADGIQGEGPDADPDDNASEVEGTRKQRKSGRTFAIIGLITVLAACGAYQLVDGGSGAVPLKRGISSAGSAQARAPGGDPSGAANAAVLPPEELRAAFRKRLADVDLLKSFDLHLQDNSWSMQAALDDEEAARFERTLASFVAQHKITFPIAAKVGNAEHMLPFKIRQVISGANASVVTLDGNRLYVGDEYNGTRLVAVKGSRLTFMGKRKIEVSW